MCEGIVTKLTFCNRAQDCNGSWGTVGYIHIPCDFVGYIKLSLISIYCGYSLTVIKLMNTTDLRLYIVIRDFSLYFVKYGLP
jgi:hypothetical protein